MSENELLNVVGGATSYVSASFLNAIARGMETIYNVGRALGSSIYYIINGKKKK